MNGLAAVVVSVVLAQTKPTAPWLEALVAPRSSTAGVKAAAKDVPHAALVSVLSEALQTDPRFRPGTMAYQHAIGLIGWGAKDAPMGVGELVLPPPLQDGLELETLFQVLHDHRADETTVTGVIGAIRLRTPDPMKHAMLDRLRFLRDRPQPDVVVSYLKVLHHWAMANDDDLALCLQIATDAPDAPPATRLAIEEAKRIFGEQVTGLQLFAFRTRWRLGLLMEDLPRLDAMDDAAQARFFPGLFIDLSLADDNGRIPLDDADVPRVWASIGAFYARRPDLIEWYPEQALVKAIQEGRGPAAMDAIHAVTRAMAVAITERIFGKRGVGGERADYIRQHPEKYGVRVPERAVRPAERRPPTP